MTNSILHPNNQRGERVRRAILAVARLAQAKDAPLPTIDTLAPLIGICREQCGRHIRHLIKNGVLVTRRVPGSKRRSVQEIHQ
jgi:DNA-binding IscR family transcriptional regulator